MSLNARKTLLEYIWLDLKSGFRSKIKIINRLDDLSIDNLPLWNYDGSSTGQAKGSNTEVILKPVYLRKNPLIRSELYDSYIVLCGTYLDYDLLKPLNNNHRDTAVALFNENREEKPWFGIEQEYFLFNPETNLPLGVPSKNFNKVLNKYYCSIGHERRLGRVIAEEHMNACIYSNLTISGINAEVEPGQWEYQIGPCEGIESGDQVLVSRYLLERIAEKHNVIVNWSPKPVNGWNGSGCHTNYSTTSMRDNYNLFNKNLPSGLDNIVFAIEKLHNKHEEHMKVYGEDNNLRMTGLNETARFDKFSWGYGTRDTSIRVGNETKMNECGYLEDRRPASNMDPYLVTSLIFKTTVL